MVQRILSASRMSTLFATLAALVLTTTPSSAQTDSAGLAWMTQVESAQQVATSRGKKVLLHFYSPEDPVSAQLERDLFTIPAVMDAIERSYIPVRINVKKAPLVRQKYRIRRWPSTLILTASGDEIFRGRTLTTRGEFLALLQSIEQSQHILTEVPTAIAANTTPHIIPVQYEQHVTDPEPVDTSAPPVIHYGTPVSAEEVVGELTTTESAVQVASLPASVPQPTRVEQPEPLEPAEASNRHKATVRWVVPHTPNEDSDMRHQARTKLNPQIFRRRPQPGTSRNVPASVRTPVATIQPRTPAPSVTPQPAIGLDGFCPVSLRGTPDQVGSWKPGDRKYGAIHRGRLYLFVGAAERDLFLKTPDLYSPVISGFDPVILADHRQLANGRRDYGIVFQGRIYLFSSALTMQQFWRAPRQYAAVADSAMKNAK